MASQRANIIYLEQMFADRKGEEMTTIFERIIKRELPSDIIFEDEYTIAITDIRPHAPVHVLVIPKKAVESLHEADEETISQCSKTIKTVATILGIDDGGYRVVTNIRVNGGQSVPHLHFHVLGGKRLTHKLG